MSDHGLATRAGGLHTSRIDGSRPEYNRPEPLLPDVLICEPELADAALAVTRTGYGVG